MKKITAIIAIVLWAGISCAFAQKNKKSEPVTEAEPAQPKSLVAILNHNAYRTEDAKTFIECQFIIDGQSAQYIPASADTYSAEIDIAIDIRKKEDNGDETSVNSYHYILVSPQIRDTNERAFFSDEQSLVVPNGVYYIYYRLKDLHCGSDTVNYVDVITVDYPDDQVSTSKISLYERVSRSGDGGVFFKYGFATTPLFQQFAPERIHALPFTVEIYNTEQVFGKGKEFFITSEIVELGHKARPEYVKTKKHPTASAMVHFDIYDIFHLPSGNYMLNVYVMDPDSNLVTSVSAFFQRSNPSIQLDLSQYDNVIVEKTFVEDMTDLRQLQNDVATLYPIASFVEQDFFNQNMKKVPLDQLQRFFYSFWLNRAPDDPETAWLEYKKKVEFVNEKYGSKVIAGFRTDRGRVYLKYGPPTSITEEPYDPQSYPYEIWHYYYIGEQTNVKFIFYNPDLVTNNYELLHSDYLGEIKDPAWQMKLVKRLSPNYNPDVTRPNEYWGGHANDYYQYNR